MRTYYIELRRFDNRIEAFSVDCDTDEQAKVYAENKQSTYPGSKIVVCRPYKGILGRER